MTLDKDFVQQGAVIGEDSLIRWRLLRERRHSVNSSGFGFAIFLNEDILKYYFGLVRFHMGYVCCFHNF